MGLNKRPHRNQVAQKYIDHVKRKFLEKNQFFSIKSLSLSNLNFNFNQFKYDKDLQYIKEKELLKT